MLLTPKPASSINEPVLGEIMKHLGVAALFAFASTVWATELTVLNCNSGSAVIVRENTHPETLTARILSKEVVDSFVNAADTVSEIRDAAGNVYHIKKAFPPRHGGS